MGPGTLALRAAAMEVPSIRAFWEAQVRSSAPITLLKSGMTEQEWEPVSAHVVERLETEFGTGPRSVGWSAFLGIGRRSGAVGTEAG